MWTEAGLVGRQSARLRSDEVGGAEEARGGPGDSEVTRLEAGMATSCPVSGDWINTNRPDIGLGDGEGDGVFTPPSASCNEKVS